MTSWGFLKCRVLSILRCKLEGINVQQCYLLKRALVHVVLAPETKYWQLMNMATCFFSGNCLPSIAMDDWKITEMSWGLPCFQTKHRNVHAILQVEWKKTAVCIGLSWQFPSLSNPYYSLYVYPISIYDTVILLPSGNLTVCYWTWHIEIGDLPNLKIRWFSSSRTVNVYPLVN